MEEKKKFKVYKIIMLLFLVIFMLLPASYSFFPISVFKIETILIILFTIYLLFKKNEGIENNSAFFADKIDSKGFGKFCNFDAITAYGMNCGIGMAARFAGFDSAFFAKVAAACGKNSCVFGIKSDFLH